MRTETRSMKIHLNTGKVIKLAFDKQTDQYHAAQMLDEILKRNILIVEVENGTLMFPLTSVEHIELSAKPENSPLHIIRGARVVS